MAKSLIITTQPEDCEFGDVSLMGDAAYYVTAEEMELIQSGHDCNWLLSAIYYRENADELSEVDHDL